MKIDLGVKPKNTKESDQPCCPSTIGKKDEIWYPSFYIGNEWDDREVPELGELKGGQELQATVRVKSVTRKEKGDGSVRYSYDFEVVSIEDGRVKKTESKASRKSDEDVIDKGIDEAMDKKEDEDE